jgi:serine protease Do
MSELADFSGADGLQPGLFVTRRGQLGLNADVPSSVYASGSTYYRSRRSDAGMMIHRSVAMLTLGLTLGLGGGALGTSLATPQAATVTSPSTATFARLAERVKPAVINVNTERRGAARTPVDEFFGEEYYRRFFGDPPERTPRRSLGSGVIIDPTGVALTNAHVVGDADHVEVVTLDGSRYKARVAGVDRKTDLAVLRLEANGTPSFPHLPLGDSNETQVGDWVLAVGSPFGLQATVTAGIISAKARQIGAGPYDDFLQTDAAINPGNSGGPLVNTRGEVIGINTAIVRGGSGIGFAIPASMAKRVASELLSKGRVIRGWLGVSLQPLTPELAASFGLKDPKGALVTEVMPESPAAAAGLRPGDVIVELNGKKVENPGDLARAVALAAPGRAARLTVWRDKQERALAVTPREAPGERQASRLGFEVRPVTAAVAGELGLRSTDGVVVAHVDDDSEAAAAGLRRGDVVVEVNREPIKTLADFERTTRSIKSGERMRVRVERGRSAFYFAFAPGRA